MTQTPAIVLDGHQRSALATTRALGRLGCPAFVAETQQRCLASSSRYCAGALVYPDPSVDPAGFLDWLSELGESRPGSVLLPMSDLTVPLVLKADLPSFRTALPTLSAYEQVSDKYTLFEHATKVGVRVPQTLRLSRGSIRTLETTGFRYPVVVKPRHSATRTADGVIKRTVRYANSLPELTAEVNAMLVGEEDEVLLQEYIKGRGEGVFAFYDRGSPVFFFAHKRVREKPPSGGVSVVCESVRPSEYAIQAARKILDPLQWHGVAMVEFKVDELGQPWLIEINARFWGSLQLAVDSGANFPGLLYQLARGEAVSAPEKIEIGRQLRWLLGDLDNLYATLTQRRFAPRLVDKITAVGRFCVPWRPGLRYELLRLSDPLPAVFAISRYIGTLGKR